MRTVRRLAKKISQLVTGFLNAAGLSLDESAYVPLSIDQSSRRDIPRIVTYLRWIVPPKWACWTALGIGTIVLLVGLGVVYFGIAYRNWQSGLIGSLLTLYALVLLAGDIRVLRLRDTVAAMKPGTEVRAQLGFEDAEFKDFARKNGIRPKFLVNDIELYDPEEFRGALTLLRAVEPEEQLVRPAVNVEQSEELLVRPAEGNRE